MDEVVICFEDQLEVKSWIFNMGEKVKNFVFGMKNLLNILSKCNDQELEFGLGILILYIMFDMENLEVLMFNFLELIIIGDDSDLVDKDDLNDEYVVEIWECFICYQLCFNKCKDIDIIIYIVICVSFDWC